MISFLHGNVIVIGEDFICIQTSGGVGYNVFCPSGFLAKITLNAEIKLFIETIVREDAITLFGFETFKELTWFKSFLKVSGVGAKTTLSILSAFKINEIIYAIESANAEFFTSVSGIGEKVATRIITEMKKEPKKNTIINSTTLVLNKIIEEEVQTQISNIVNECILALESLGYNRSISYKVVLAIFSENPTISLNDLIKLALKKINT